MAASVQPDRFAKAADGYTDVGFDANWQWFPSRRHAFTVNSSFIHEVRSFNASVAAGGADHLDTDLEQFKVAAAYYYRQRYGATTASVTAPPWAFLILGAVATERCTAAVPACPTRAA
jgi:hypothetical protein